MGNDHSEVSLSFSNQFLLKPAGDEMFAMDARAWKEPLAQVNKGVLQPQCLRADCKEKN